MVSKVLNFFYFVFFGEGFEKMNIRYLFIVLFIVYILLIFIVFFFNCFIKSVIIKYCKLFV